ncbi:MAG: hypothetical protein ACO3PR_11600, partial [Limisphaerales bacterium]
MDRKSVAILIFSVIGFIIWNKAINNMYPNQGNQPLREDGAQERVIDDAAQTDTASTANNLAAAATPLSPTAADLDVYRLTLDSQDVA